MRSLCRQVARYSELLEDILNVTGARRFLPPVRVERMRSVCVDIHPDLNEGGSVDPSVDSSTHLRVVWRRRPPTT